MSKKSESVSSLCESVHCVKVCTTLTSRKSKPRVDGAAGHLANFDVPRAIRCTPLVGPADPSVDMGIGQRIDPNVPSLNVVVLGDVSLDPIDKLVHSDKEHDSPKAQGNSTHEVGETGECFVDHFHREGCECTPSQSTCRPLK